MPSSSIRTQEKEEIGKAAHGTAVVGGGTSEVRPVLGEGDSIAAMYLEGIKKLVCFKAIGKHDYIGLDSAALCL